jgi:hypothetical protein
LPHSLVCDVALYAEKDNCAVFDGISSRFQATNDAKSFPVMNIFCEMLKSDLEVGKRKVAAVDKVAVKTEF